MWGLGLDQVVGVRAVELGLVEVLGLLGVLRAQGHLAIAKAEGVAPATAFSDFGDHVNVGGEELLLLTTEAVALLPLEGGLALEVLALGAVGADDLAGNPEYAIFTAYGGVPAVALALGVAAELVRTVLREVVVLAQYARVVLEQRNIEAKIDVLVDLGLRKLDGEGDFCQVLELLVHAQLQPDVSYMCHGTWGLGGVRV